MCWNQKHLGFSWQWNYPQKFLLKWKQGGKVLFYLGILFFQTAMCLRGKTCYIKCAYWKMGFWNLSLLLWVTLGPYDFSDTETLCRDLAVRLQTSEKQILAKLITTWSWKNIAFLLVVCGSQVSLEVEVELSHKGLVVRHIRSGSFINFISPY